MVRFPSPADNETSRSYFYSDAPAFYDANLKDYLEERGETHVPSLELISMQMKTEANRFCSSSCCHQTRIISH